MPGSCMSMAENLALVAFTLIIDDIVLPDGSTSMNQLGGGGPQTLWGFQLATHQRYPAALAAGVGADLPATCKEWLAFIGAADTSGLILHLHPTPRAWQVFEVDGRRTQVWRGKDDPCDQLYKMLRPSFSDLPPRHRAARNYHLGIHANHPPMRLLKCLREAAHAQGDFLQVLMAWPDHSGACLLSIEPYTMADRPLTASELATLMTSCDVFSPNEREAASILGAAPDTDPTELVGRLLEAGAGRSSPAEVVTLRCGADGAYAKHRVTEELWQVPAYGATHVADVTGCGNAFCGAFLAAWTGLATGATCEHNSNCSIATPSNAYAISAGNDPPRMTSRRHSSSSSSNMLLESVVWGCAAGSLMAEDVGTPHTPIPLLQVEVDSRRDWLRTRASRSAVAPQPRASTGTARMPCGTAALRHGRHLTAIQRHSLLGGSRLARAQVQSVAALLS